VGESLGRAVCVVHLHQQRWCHCSGQIFGRLGRASMLAKSAVFGSPVAIAEQCLREWPRLLNWPINDRVGLDLRLPGQSECYRMVNKAGVLKFAREDLSELSRLLAEQPFGTAGHDMIVAYERFRWKTYQILPGEGGGQARHLGSFRY
jgi:hypothetical protein